jgi:hypothetical protein
MKSLADGLSQFIRQVKKHIPIHFELASVGSEAFMKLVSLSLSLLFVCLFYRLSWTAAWHCCTTRG